MTTKNTHSIGIANSGDIWAIKALVESAYRGDSAKAGWTYESDLIDGERLDDGELEGVISNPDCALFLARSKETAQIDGCICVYRFVDYCEFGMFAVNPNLQSGGIGKQLLSFAEDFVKTEWGFNKLRLSVITARDNLISFYLRRGYLPTSKTFSMSDHHLTEDMTRGHDLTLAIYEKQL